jgi:parvulin-like peptidyl-prolyl isomerase
MKKTSFILVTTTVISVLLLSSCGKSNKTVIKVKNTKVTVSDVKEMLKDTPENYRYYLATDIGKKQFVDMLAREKLVVAAAREKGIQNRKEVKDQIAKFKKDYAKRLKEYENSLLVTTLLKELQDKQFTPTETDLEQYYGLHKREFTEPVELRVSHILVPTAPEAENVIRQIRSGTSFEQLAKQLSIDPSSNMRGGDLGAFKKNEIFPEFEPVLAKLRAGEVASAPVQTNFGYHVIKKTGEKRLKGQNYDEAKPEIRQLVIKERFDKWIEQKKTELGLKVDYDALKLITELGDTNSLNNIGKIK